MNAQSRLHQAAADGARAEWRGHPERGSRALLALMAALSLRLGRPAGRVILRLIALYFFAFAPRARRHMRTYLQRALGRAPRARERFRLIMTFATTTHDRLYLFAGRHRLFDVSIDGEPLLRATLERGAGVLLFGAHLGSFEVLRAIGARAPGLQVAMAMYEDNARKLNAILAGAVRDAGAAPEIIRLGRVDALLRVRERLEQGAWVGLLADRTLGEEPALPVPFLGGVAHFPIGPMRVAAMLHARVLFMVGLYRGGNRYRVIFESLADFSDTPATARTEAVRAAVVRYAALLEAHCRTDPYNWFNFFDFWRAPPVREPAPGPAPAPALLAATLLALGIAAGPHARAAGQEVSQPVVQADARKDAPQPADAATEDTLEQLMHLLAQRRYGEAGFEQEQHLSVLERPLRSSGELIYRAPDHLEQRTLEPRAQSMVLDHGELTFTSPARTRRVRLSDLPQAGIIVDCIRATLAGDRTALQSTFSVRLEGDLAHWRLRLEPRDPAVAGVQHIDLAGERADVLRVFVQQRNGDFSVLRIHPRD